jgi:hypothetical protein
MAWYQSVEGISKLLLMVAGLVLLFTGKVEIGMVLLAATGALKAATEIDKKKNGKSSAAAILFLCGILFFASSGCQMLGELPGEVIDMNLQVYDVYDQYIMDDLNLSPLERQQLLRSTSILRQIMILLRSGATSIDLLLVE